MANALLVGIHRKWHSSPERVGVAASLSSSPLVRITSNAAPARLFLARHPLTSSPHDSNTAPVTLVLAGDTLLSKSVVRTTRKAREFLTCAPSAAARLELHAPGPVQHGVLGQLNTAVGGGQFCSITTLVYPSVSFELDRLRPPFKRRLPVFQHCRRPLRLELQSIPIGAVLFAVGTHRIKNNPPHFFNELFPVPTYRLPQLLRSILVANFKNVPVHLEVTHT